MWREGNSPVGAWIEARFEPREAALEFVERALAASGKTRLLPYLIKPSRIAGIAPLEVHRADLEPAGNPDVDGVVLGQGTPCGAWRWFVKERDGHDFFVFALRLGFAKPAAMRECGCLTPDAIRD
ncbi:hypothetical protein SAMN04488557_3350 [Hyphomicrobium facile]|uniref:Uncharacterized protein n=1 Tax=Hyphomicrobium facile TaxID=51670 RepID=A0A1I7NT72_9HYPH|nr:hypothetical protein SAMN04488557_3350 [Hyphomicrobium facile]